MKDEITNDNKKIKPKARRRSCLSGLIIIILVSVVVFPIIFCASVPLFFSNYRVVGNAMQNNLKDGQFLFIEKLSYSQFMSENLNAGGATRGDVIVFEHPNYREQLHIMRIIGLPDETIDIQEGQIFINNQLLVEPFDPVADAYNLDNPIIVPTGHVFVLGDNRGNSNDSRHWGMVPIEDITGRAWLTYWPPNEWGAIPRD